MSRKKHPAKSVTHPISPATPHPVTFTDHSHNFLAGLTGIIGPILETQAQSIMELLAQHTQAVVNAAAVSGVAALDKQLTDRLNLPEIPPLNPLAPTPQA